MPRGGSCAAARLARCSRNTCAVGVRSHTCAASPACKDASPATGRMSKKMLAESVASAVGSVSQDVNRRRHCRTGRRHRSLTAMTSPGHRR